MVVKLIGAAQLHVQLGSHIEILGYAEQEVGLEFKLYLAVQALVVVVERAVVAQAPELGWQIVEKQLVVPAVFVVLHIVVASEPHLHLPGHTDGKHGRGIAPLQSGVLAVVAVEAGQSAGYTQATGGIEEWSAQNSPVEGLVTLLIGILQILPQPIEWLFDALYLAYRVWLLRRQHNRRICR